MQRALKSTITPSEQVTVFQADTGGQLIIMTQFIKLIYVYHAKS